MKEIALFILSVAAVLAIPVVVLWEMQVGYIKQECDNYRQVTGKETIFQRPSWGMAGCYVKTDNGWFYLDQIRQNSVSE